MKERVVSLIFDIIRFSLFTGIAKEGFNVCSHTLDARRVGGFKFQMLFCESARVCLMTHRDTQVCSNESWGLMGLFDRPLRDLPAVG